MKRKFIHILQWLVKRGSFFVATLLLTVTALLLLSISKADTQTATNMPIASRATAAFFAAVSSIFTLI